MANKYYNPATADGQVLYRAEFNLVQTGFDIVETDFSAIDLRIGALETNDLTPQVNQNTSDIATNATNHTTHLSDPNAHTQYNTVANFTSHVNSPLHIPVGGAVGETVVKTGAGDYATGWGQPTSNVEQIGAIITDDAGNGTVHDDLNSTDFTGDPNADPTVTTALRLESYQVIYFGHKNLAYIWLGPKDTTVGLGGAYTALSTDLTPTGTSDHAALTGLDTADSHPQSAIGGRGLDLTLLADQITQDGRLTAVEAADVTQDGRLTAVEAKDTEQDGRLTTNESKNTEQDGRLTTNETWQTEHTDGTVPDPHTQYLETLNALSVFTYVAYGGMHLGVATPWNNITGTWQTIDVFDTLSITTPRGITVNTTNNTISFDEKGVYTISITIVFEHNETSGGRTTQIRMYNTTDAAPGRGVVLATGRNQSATSFSTTLIFEILDADIGDIYRFEIGSGDTYSSVVMDTMTVDSWSIGEFRGVLPS